VAVTRTDPFRSFNFLVSFVDSGDAGIAATVSLGQSAALGGFSEISGLETTLEVEDYNEGGRNDGVRRFPTRITWSNLRLKRGIALSDDLWSWHYGFVEGRGRRRDGIVTLLDERREPVRVWQFRRGLPVKWTGPTLNAGQSEVAVEEVEIAHEGLTLVSARTLMGVGELVGAAVEAGTRAIGAARDAVGSARDLIGR
jgi:phage tail-like protein